MENNMEVLQQIKCWTTVCSHFWEYIQRNLNHYLKKTSVSPNSLQHFHNSQDKEATLIPSVNEWIKKMWCVYIYIYIYIYKMEFGHKKECNPAT